MKKRKLAKNEILDENGHIKKKGFFAWVLNYGYYYRSYVIVGVVAIGFFIALYFSMQSVKPDLKFYFCVEQELGEAQYQAFCDNLYEYLIDVDGDDVVYMEPITLHLVPEPSTTSERSAYRTMEDAIEDNDIICFVTDEFGYLQLMEQNALRDMAFFGINSDDEYRLLLNDTALWNGVEETENYYLVMKYVPDELYQDFYFSTITTMIVDMCYDLVGEPTQSLEN